METQQPAQNEVRPKQRVLAAMLLLINTLPEGRERACAVEACVQLAWRLWGWNVERFRDELSKATP